MPYPQKHTPTRSTSTPSSVASPLARLLRLAARSGLALAALTLALPGLRLAAQTAAPAAARFSAEEREQGFRLGYLLARPAPGTAEADLVSAERLQGAQLERHVGRGRELRLLAIDATMDVRLAAEQLQATGRYAFVEPDFLVRADATPNDPRFAAGDQWALRNIGQNNGTAGADIRAEEGWDIQSSAASVIVAVIDSGLRRTHEDIAANLWVNTGESSPNPNNLRDDDGNTYVDDVNGINATVAPSNSAAGNIADVDGHGTAVASVIGAVGNNGAGMTGVAWNVKLMGLRFIDADGFGLISDEIECIDYAIARGAALINASFGGTSFSQSLFDALKRARDAGIIVVCSAGNDAESSDLFPHYPSGYLLDNIVAVANSTRTDALAATSTYGTGTVELAAPGSSILVADAGSDRGYLSVSGTSFSAPMVTGALALVKQKFPGEHYRQTINRVLGAVDRKAAFEGKTATGGRLNLAAALRTTHGRPFNDDFARRAVFVGEAGSARSSAQFSTRETGEPTEAGSAATGSVWWTWTAPRGGSLTLDTAASAFDTVLTVYTGTALGALTRVATNDNESAAVNTSKLTLTVVAGTTYQIAVESKAAASGLVALRFALQSSNDDFASAQLVTGRSWSVRSDNRTATRETGEPRIRNNIGGASVWYRWVAPATRRYHLASFSSDFNTMVGVFTGTSVGALTEVSTSTTGGDSNYTMSSGSLAFNATAGTTYHFVIDSEAGTTGTITRGEFFFSLADSEWEFFGVGATSTVAIAADGTIHFSDALGYLYALAPDGARKWRHALSGFGTYSAPAVAADGTCYVGDSLGYVHAVNPDGNRKWRLQTPGVVQSSPAIAADGTVYVRSDDGRLSAIEPSGGTLKWSFRTGTGASATYTSPSIAPDGTVYCAGADNKLYAVTPDGVQKWTFSTDFIYASPTIGADGTVYFGCFAPTRRFYAVRPDGTLKWEYVVGDSISASAVIGLDGTIFVGCVDQKIYAFTPSGQLRWTYETGGAIRNSSPVVASDGTLYVGSLDGKLYALDSEGTLRRTYGTSNELRASPVLHQGRLYVPSWDYRVYAFETGQVPASTAWPMHRQNVRRTARFTATPLSIAVQPRPVTAEVGDVVAFSVGALGTAPITYQWSVGGQPIAGATGASYRIDPVSHASAGSYSVRVTDATGSATSSAAALTVSTPLLPPSVFTAPAAVNALAGQRLALSVAATGTTPITYQWLKDGQPVAGATSATFVVDVARPSDSGSYSVRLTNFAATVTSAAAAVVIAPVSRISNLSIRSQVAAGTGALTVGLTVGGEGTSGAKPLLMRAVGPTLAAFGVGDALADPKLELLSGATVVVQNDDWAGNAQVTATNTAVGAFGFASAASKDSALVHSPDRGGYTVRITGADGTGGVSLAEIYDASPSDTFFATTPRLTNVSALTGVGTGGDILIAGFSITGTTRKTVLVRGIGPTLAAFGVGDALADPKIELFAAGQATALATNDNWVTSANAPEISAAAAKVGAFALAADSKDAVLLLALQPGTYTAQISGVGGTSGTALVEVYEVP